MTRLFNILMRVTNKQKMNHEHNYWHAPVSSRTLSTDALVLAISVIPDIVCFPPSGSRLSATSFQVYRCRSTRTFTLKILGLNPRVFPFGAECCRIRPLRESCAVALQGLWGASLLLTQERCPLRVLSAVAPQGLFFWVFGACRTESRVQIPSVGDKDFLCVRSVVSVLRECYSFVMARVL